MRNRKGQVAVEFLFMFILCASVIIYIFYFGLSLAALQYRQYETFMVGRAITSSSPRYADKSQRANAVMGLYNDSDSGEFALASNFQCSINDASTGFRDILKYSSGGAAYYVFSTAGIACSVSLNDVLPGILTGNSGKTVEVAIESMTGTEISDQHCNCMRDFSKNWKDCLNEVAPNDPAIIDNGC